MHKKSCLNADVILLKNVMMDLNLKELKSLCKFVNIIMATSSAVNSVDFQTTKRNEVSIGRTTGSGRTIF